MDVSGCFKAITREIRNSAKNFLFFKVLYSGCFELFGRKIRCWQHFFLVLLEIPFCCDQTWPLPCYTNSFNIPLHSFYWSLEVHFLVIQTAVIYLYTLSLCWSSKVRLADAASKTCELLAASCELLEELLQHKESFWQHPESLMRMCISIKRLSNMVGPAFTITSTAKERNL